MAKQLLGKEVAEALTGRLAKRCDALRARGIKPRLAIVRCGANPSDLAYERGAMKRAEAAGVDTARVILPETVLRDELIAKLEELNQDASIHGVLLFRPLPESLKPYESEICSHLAAAKDVDCMTDLSNAGVYEGKALGFPPCTAQACIEIFDHYRIELTGKNVAVIGRSLVIGRPAAMMLMARHATVTICHTRTRDVAAITRRADIIVSSAGVLGSLTADFVSPGQTVVDVSINWDPKRKDGKGGIAGDAVFEEVEPIVGAITPVPGGVGAVTTAVLLEHVVTAAERLGRGSAENSMCRQS